MPILRIARSLLMTAIGFAVVPGYLPQETIQASEQQKPAAWLEPAESRTTIYDADPEHLWNRLHEALWVRRDGAGRAIGRHRLDPLLWAETVHVLEGDAHERAVKVLEEFVNQDGEKRIHDPVKRAVLQRDLWAVFDWLVVNPAFPLSGRVDRFMAISPERELADAESTASFRKLRALLARAIAALALSDDELKTLPDNYQAAAATGNFLPQFDPDHPNQPFLPGDLLDPAGTWLLLTQPFPLLVTREHFNRLPRSEFLVFLKIPAGRQATIEFVEQLNKYKAATELKLAPAALSNLPHFGDDAPQIPIGTQVALVRRMLLIGDDGKVRTTPLVESVELRVFRAISKDADAQAFFHFALHREDLFRAKAGGLHAATVDATDIKELLNPHPYDPLENCQFRERPIEQRAFNSLQFCRDCHTREAGLNSILCLRHVKPQSTTASFEANASSACIFTEQRFSVRLLKESVKTLNAPPQNGKRDETPAARKSPQEPGSKVESKRHVDGSEQQRRTDEDVRADKDEDVRADKAYDAFLKTRDYGAMLDIVKSWKQKLDPPAQKEIVIRLMRGLGSTKTTPANEEHVAIMWRVMKRREPTPRPDTRDWTWQDLLIEGGRCAWALERLLEYDLPPIHEALTADERRAAVTESQARIVRAMAMPPTVNATALPEAERIKVAESERTHPRVLAEFANDTSVAVRRAVASNRFTPPHVLKKLYKDSDPEVVERAQKNFLLITPQERPR